MKETITASLFKDGWAILENQRVIAGGLSHVDAQRIIATCRTKDEVLAAVALITA